MGDLPVAELYLLSTAWQIAGQRGVSARDIRGWTLNVLFFADSSGLLHINGKGSSGDGTAWLVCGLMLILFAQETGMLDRGAQLHSGLLLNR